MPEPQESNPNPPKKKAHMNAAERRELRLKQRATMLESRRSGRNSTKNSPQTGKATSNGFNNKDIKSCVHNQGKTGRKVGAG